VRIERVVASAGLTGFYNDDQEAIRRGAVEDGFVYRGEPVTPGFVSIRQKGESVSVMLVLEDGQIAVGDCVSVQYAGTCGRDAPCRSSEVVSIVENQVVGQLVGRQLSDFRALAGELDALRLEGQGHSSALRYGLTQAVLDAVARDRRQTMMEVIVEEYDLPLTPRPVAILAQTGDDRYTNVDKMILKRVGALPHGLINNVETKLGRRGELLLDYLRWVKERIASLGDADYTPALHFDVYGTIGQAFGMDIARMTEYLGSLEHAAAPLDLRIEHPVDAGTKEGQIEVMSSLVDALRRGGIGVKIVADEWANTLQDIRDFVDAKAAHMVEVKAPDLGGINNTIEAILYAKNNGVEAYLAGSSNVTDHCARVCAHVALATQPTQVAAVPGMGVDEGLMILHNEMYRILRLLRK
jgi:methylaspartate ammonia-lyase